MNTILFQSLNQLKGDFFSQYFLFLFFYSLWQAMRAGYSMFGFNNASAWLLLKEV